MGKIFGGGGSKPKPVTIPPPIYEPPQITEDTGAGDAEKKKLKKKSGRKSTFLTGDLVPSVDVNRNLKDKLA